MSRVAVGLFLVFTVASTVAQRASPDTSQSMEFTAIPPEESETGTLQLRCSFERSKTDIIELNKLSISESSKDDDTRVSGRLGYMQASSPVNSYGENVLKISGTYDNDGASTVDVTFVSNEESYCRTYWCIGAGYNAEHAYNSYYRKVTVDPSLCAPLLKRLAAKVDQCSAATVNVSSNSYISKNMARKIDELSYLAKDSEEQSEQLEKLSERVSELASTPDVAQENTRDIAALESQISELEKKVAEQVAMQNQMQSYVEMLTQYDETLGQVVIKVLSIDTVKYDVSRRYGQTVYIASKNEEQFDLEAMNELCKASNGYLAEIDDEDEQKFVGDFISSISDDVFAIGGNDVENEGEFVFYNSKKPMPANLWEKNEPNNLGNEDCVQIAPNGLNDIKCNRKWRYVCEVPIV